MVSSNPFTGQRLDLEASPRSNAPYTGLVDPRGQPLLSEEERTRQAAYGPFAIPTVVTFSAMVGHAWRTFFHGHHDEAVKAGFEEKMAMKRDAFLMALLQERKLGSASLKWRIKVDNERNPWQKTVQEGLTKIVQSTRFLAVLRYYLLEAIWYGRYGSQLVWEWAGMNLPVPGQPDQTAKQRVLRIKHHAPINGDKIDFQWDGTPYVLINSTSGLGGASVSAVKGFQTIITPVGGRGALLNTENIRQRFVIHKHEALDADFLDYHAASATHGVGVRSVLFWGNWLRNEWMANISDWVERTGLGVRLWYYQGGNAKSKEAVAEAARNTSADKTNILIPRFGDQAVEGVDYVDTTSSGAQLLLQLMEHIETYLERYVIGQTLSSDTEGSGLGGTGVASMHADTKSKIIAFDANNSDDAWSQDVIEVIKQWTYPWADFPAHFKSDLDEHDAEKVLGAITQARSMGVDFIEDEVRGLIPGVSDPQEGDRTLQMAEQEKMQRDQQMQMDQAQQQMQLQGQQQAEQDARGLQNQLALKGAEQGHQDRSAQAGREFEAQQSWQAQQAENFARDGVRRYAYDETKHPRGEHGHWAHSALQAIPHGEMKRVGGWQTRRTGENTWRIDTDKGHVEGDSEAIGKHLDRHDALARLEGSKYHDAMARGHGHDEPDALNDPERLNKEREGFHKLPHGTRVVSLHPESKGRVGTIHKGEDGNKVKLDDEPGFASDFVEPLDEKHSWRKKSGSTAEPKQVAFTEKQAEMVEGHFTDWESYYSAGSILDPGNLDSDGRTLEEAKTEQEHATKFSFNDGAMTFVPGSSLLSDICHELESVAGDTYNDKPTRQAARGALKKLEKWNTFGQEVKEEPQAPQAPQAPSISELRPQEAPTKRGKLFDEIADEVLNETQGNLFGEQSPRQGRLFAREDVQRYKRKTKGDGRWITIGGTKGEDGKRHGGSPVFIEGGRITKGHPSLVGKKLGEDERSVKKKAKEENRADWTTKAKGAGINHEHLHAHAKELMAHDKEFVEEKKRVLGEARSALDEFGGQWKTLAARSGRKRGADDWVGVKGIDEVAGNLAQKYPHHFHPETGEHGGHEDQLFDMLMSGNPSAMSEDDAYEQAMEHLMAMKAQEDEQGDAWEPGGEDIGGELVGAGRREESVPFARGLGKPADGPQRLVIKRDKRGLIRTIDLVKPKKKKNKR